MIDPTLLDDPRYRRAAQEFTNSVRMYWRRNIGLYFQKRRTEYSYTDPNKNYYTFGRKMNHRISISTGASSKTLRNVLEINWAEENNHVTVRPGKLMVQGSGKSHNLIDILVQGRPATPNRYVVAIDKRVQGGTRGPQENDQWIAWMNVFIPYVDKKLIEFANVTETVVVDNLVEEF